MKHGIYLTRGPVTVRPLTPEHAPFLLKWMTEPRVLEFYEGRDAVFTPERILKDFYQEEWNARRCIVEYEEQPIGYLQIYRLDEELCREYHYSHLGGFSFGIDQFIGEPEYWNRKIGRTFLTLVLEYLTGTEGARSVILDPHADNPRALRCYEACGFRKLKLLEKHEMHEGERRDCWLMEYLPENSP